MNGCRVKMEPAGYSGERDEAITCEALILMSRRLERQTDTVPKEYIKFKSKSPCWRYGTVDACYPSRGLEFVSQH